MLNDIFHILKNDINTNNQLSFNEIVNFYSDNEENMDRRISSLQSNLFKLLMNKTDSFTISFPTFELAQKWINCISPNIILEHSLICNINHYTNFKKRDVVVHDYKYVTDVCICGDNYNLTIRNTDDNKPFIFKFLDTGNNKIKNHLLFKAFFYDAELLDF